MAAAALSRAERFLEGRGAWAIPVGRMLPFVRAFISIVAGLVRVPAGRFGVLSLIGTVIYAATLSSIGYALGSAWTLFGRLGSSFRFATIDDNGLTSTGNLLQPQTAKNIDAGVE